MVLFLVSKKEKKNILYKLTDYITSVRSPTMQDGSHRVEKRKDDGARLSVRRASPVFCGSKLQRLQPYVHSV